MGWMRWTRAIGAVVLAVGLYFLVPVDDQASGGPVLRALLAVVVLATLAAAVLAQVRFSAREADRRVDGLVLAIVGVWLVFAFGFYLLSVHGTDQVQGLETRLDGLYFTATTMLTIGYGDVHATGQVARALVLVQIFFNVVFVAAAVSLLTMRVRDRATGSRRRDDGA